MATAISDTNFKNACGEVFDAIELEDWALAKKWYAKAEAQNAGLEVEAGDAGARLRRHDALDGLRRAIDAAKVETTSAGQSSPFITTKTKY